MKRKSYTLVEMLVVVALFGLLFAIIFELLAANRTAWDIGSTKQTIENEARFGLENMARELYRTDSNRINVTGGGNNQAITFQIPTGSNNTTGNLIWGADGTPDYYLRYIINTTQLLRQVLDNNYNPVNNSTRVLAADIQGLQFSNNTSLLNITLTAQRSGLGKRTLSQTFSSTVTFRN